MKAWTKEEKYRVYKDADRTELELLHQKIKASPYRQSFHIQALTGLLNDPNSFAYFDGKWRLFYQWFPFGAIHGMKHWYLMESDDLVTWEAKGLKIKADTIYDNYGVYSGSGMEIDGKLHIFYTGNSRDEAFVRHPYQCFAIMDKDGSIRKSEKPLISESPLYTEHQRDPKIYFDEKTNNYYIFIGAQDKALKGKAIVYKFIPSEETPRFEQGAWDFLGELKVKGYEDFGYMWECPDLIQVGEKYVLLFSPQGLEPQDYKYRNIFQNGYLEGDMDFESLTFTPSSEFRELDHGFEFYASQTAAYVDRTTGEKNHALIAWMGLPDVTYPTDEEEWSGCMTLPRILTLKEDRLYQSPVDEMKNLRKHTLYAGQEKLWQGETKPSEYLIEGIQGNLELHLFGKGNGVSHSEEKLINNGLKIVYNKDDKTLTMDRGQMNQAFNLAYGGTRTVELEEALHTLQIYVDHSSVEVFINQGKYSMTARIFPTAEEKFTQIRLEEVASLKLWEMGVALEDKFII